MEKPSLGGNLKDYESLYGGAHKGDTWTLPENSDLNPRLKAVEMIRSKFKGPVRLLDVGCGKAINTKWIAGRNDGSSWIGIDVLPKEKIGLQVENDKNHRFIEGNIFDENLRKINGLENKKFDIIIDQGAVFLEIDNPQELNNYLKTMYGLLNDNGILLVLSTMSKEKTQTIFFPDGRKRVLRTAEDFQKEPFSKYFLLEEDAKQNIFAYGGYSYLPDAVDEKNPKNPMGSRVGDKEQLRIAQVPFRKKSII